MNFQLNHLLYSGNKVVYYYLLLIFLVSTTVSIGQTPQQINEVTPCGFSKVYTDITFPRIANPSSASVQETTEGFLFNTQGHNGSSTRSIDVLINKDGDFLSQNTIDTAIVRTSVINENTVVSASANRINSTIFLIKSEVGGGILWEQNIPISNTDSIINLSVLDFAEVSDGYLITGNYETISRLAPNMGAGFQFIVKTDLGGNFENIRNYTLRDFRGRFTYLDYQTTSRAVYLGYQTISRTGHIMKITLTGETAWDISVLGDLVSNRIENVRISADGASIYVVGYRDPTAFVRKYDAITGTLIWEVFPGRVFSDDGDFTREERVEDIILTADEGIVVGYPYRSTSGNGEGYEYGKLDADGNPIWWKRLPSTPVDYRGLIPRGEAMDGSLLFSGAVGTFFSVIKTTANGELTPTCDAQPTPTCAAEILNLTSQAEVDNFGFCTVFDGNIAVVGADITNLDGLKGLTEITGSFFIRSTAASLQNIDGLSDLRTIGEGIEIVGTQNRQRQVPLTNLDGFSNLRSVGNRIFISGTLLQNVDGLSKVTRLSARTSTIRGNEVLFRGSLQLVDNEALETINVAGLSRIEGELTIAGNPALTQINFSQFLTIKDQLTIANNANLTTIISSEGLLSRLGQDTLQNQILTLTDNPQLAACCFLLSDTELVDIQRITISENAPSCANLTAIEDVCLTRCSGDITFNSQAELDAFLPCERFKGSIVLNGADITDLSNFRGLKEITGNLTLSSALTSLREVTIFFNLFKIGGALTIRSPGITSLEGFHNLKEVGSIFMEDTNIASLGSFTRIETITNNLTLTTNTSLEDFGFLFLKSIGGNFSVSGNTNLKQLNGLSNLTSIGGSIFLVNNAALTNIGGLRNITAIGNVNTGRLEIHANPLLDDCCIIEQLIDNTKTEQILIRNNGTKCANVEAIQLACAPPVIPPDTSKTDLALSISTPNPNPDIYTRLPVTVTIENNSAIDATAIKVVLIVCGDRSSGFQSVSQLVYASTKSETNLGTYDYLLQEWEIPNLSANSTATLSINLFTLTADELNVIAYIDSASPEDQDSTPDHIQFDRDCTVDEDDEALLALNAIRICDCPEDESMPVCGSDGYTYSSACEAECAGVSWEADACEIASGSITCDEITITYGDEIIEVIGQQGEQYFFKIHRRQPVWEYVFECNGKCGFGQTVRNLSAGTYYVDVYDKSWHLLCDDIEVTLTSKFQSAITHRFSGSYNGSSNQAKPITRLSAAEVAIYPNPANEHLILTYQAEKSTRVSIFSTSGQEMYSQQLSIGNSQHSVDLQQLPEGLYLLKIEEEGRQLVNKKIVKRK